MNQKDTYLRCNGDEMNNKQVRELANKQTINFIRNILHFAYNMYIGIKKVAKICVKLHYTTTSTST